MGRRGPKPDYARREAFAKLITEGVSSKEACRVVGIHPRTGIEWRNGRRRLRCGRVLNFPPVITIGSKPEKRYSPRYLSEDERIRLADLRSEKRTMREIAALLGRSTSTISRELSRGGDAAGRYRPFEAHRRAQLRRHPHRLSRLARDATLRDWVVAKLMARWSPEQISRKLRREFPEDPDRWLCTETIYQAVYRPDLGGLPRELPGRVLHQRRRQRLPRRHAQARRSSGRVAGLIPIANRPAAALERVEPGHWEGDLLVGAANASAIVTLVERVTRCTLLGHLPGPRHDSASVRDTVLAALAPLPAHLRRTLTWDQGSEMARHAEITASLGTEVYFCDAHSPWQRPSNENTNGLLRDYFPKGSDLSVHSADDIARVEAELNRRPRKVLDWDSPTDRMATLLATTSVLRR